VGVTTTIHLLYSYHPSIHPPHHPSFPSSLPRRLPLKYQTRPPITRAYLPTYSYTYTRTWTALPWPASTPYTHTLYTQRTPCSLIPHLTSPGPSPGPPREIAPSHLAPRACRKAQGTSGGQHRAGSKQGTGLVWSRQGSSKGLHGHKATYLTYLHAEESLAWSSSLSPPTVVTGPARSPQRATSASPPSLSLVP